MVKKKTKRVKLPGVRVWAWTMAGGLCSWALPTACILRREEKPSDEARPVLCRLVPERTLQALLAAKAAEAAKGKEQQIAELKAALASVQDENTDLEAVLAERKRKITVLEQVLNARDQQLASRDKENERPQVIVDRLDRTRDNVPITPDTELWYIHPKGKVYRWQSQPGRATTHYDNAGVVHWISETDCYSSREAAEASKERANDVGN